MSAPQQKCPARIYRGLGFGSQVCGKSAAYEHNGVCFCKLHHPPTLQAKREARSAALTAKWDAERAVRISNLAAAVEQKRRAELFHELLALLVESQESIGGDWRERRDAAIAKALRVTTKDAEVSNG